MEALAEIDAAIPCDGTGWTAAAESFELSAHRRWRREIRQAARLYKRQRDLPRDFGIEEQAGLEEPRQTRRLVRLIGHRIHVFVREGYRYEPWVTRHMALKRLRIALAGELARLRAFEPMKEAAE